MKDYDLELKTVREILLKKVKELDEISKMCEPEMLVVCTNEILKIYQILIRS